MSVCSPVSSPRLQSWCSIFLLGVSVSVSGLPFTQKCKTRLLPAPAPAHSCYHHCWPGHWATVAPLHLFPTLPYLSYPVSCKPYGFFLVAVFSFRSLCLRLSPGPHLALALLHCYLPSFFCFNHCIILSFHCRAPLMAPHCPQGEV